MRISNFSFFLPLFFIFLCEQLVAYGQEPMHARPFSLEDTKIPHVVPKPDNSTQVLPPCTTSPNNNFANAITLTVGAAAITGTTCGNLEAGEQLACNPGADQTVWYKFTATAGTSYVTIDANASSCYVGSCIWPGNTLPTNRCTMLDCQAASNGPLITTYKIVGAIGTTYAIQLAYGSGAFCGTEGSFNIKVANSYVGTISNPGSVNTCAAAPTGCYFTSPPSVATVTGTCPGYALITQTNLVNNYFVRFTTAAVNSIQLSFQNIIQSNCGAGNVQWFFYRLFDASCNLVGCGDLGNLQNNVACNTTYVLEYMWEELPCTYTMQWPYQFIPTGTIGCGTLPVELIYFEGNLRNNKVDLKWTTASEINNNYFQIERSIDNENFVPVGRIEGAGNSSAAVNYLFVDELPRTGIYYYRLKQIDFDGNYSFSKIIAVNFNRLNTFVISPNPAMDRFSLQCSADADTDVTMRLIDFKGSVLKDQHHYLKAGFSSTEISIEDLPQGIYTVELISESGAMTQKLVRL